jgi:hypothetical protein
MAEREDPVTYNSDPYRDAYVSDRDDDRDSRRIRADIDRTRASMDATFDALDSKLTPSQLLLEGWGLLKGGSGAGASRLMRVAREHPLPSLVIGAGLSWLLLERSRGTSGSNVRSFDRRTTGYGSYGGSGRGGSYDYGSGRAYDRAYGRSTYDFESGEDEGGKLSAVADTVKDKAGSAKDAVAGAAHKVGDLAGQAGDKVGDLAGSVREGASRLGDRTREQAQRARTGFWQMLEERPLSVGAATLALGVIAGLSIPSTDKENELMGETRDRLLDKAREVGEETLDKGKQVAQTAVETLKEEAERQDLTASGLVDKVRTVAQHTADAVKEEAKNQKLTPEELTRQAQGQQGQGQPGPQGVDNPKPAPVEEPELVKR